MRRKFFQKACSLPTYSLWCSYWEAKAFSWKASHAGQNCAISQQHSCHKWCLQIMCWFRSFLPVHLRLFFVWISSGPFLNYIRNLHYLSICFPHSGVMCFKLFEGPLSHAVATFFFFFHGRRWELLRSFHDVSTDLSSKENNGPKTIIGFNKTGSTCHSLKRL